MSKQNPISDMLTSIRNGQTAKKTAVITPSSKVKVAIAKVLKDEGFIEDYSITETDKKTELTIVLKYYNDKPVIEMIKQVSKPSLRIYRKLKDLPKVMGGLGIAIISTPKGVVTDRAARAQGLGGEVICTVA